MPPRELYELSERHRRELEWSARARALVHDASGRNANTRGTVDDVRMSSLFVL